MSAVKTRMVPALYNALSILELLASSRSGLSLADLVEQANLAKSSVHYLLVTLERCGYVRRSERNGRYMMGVKLFSMGNLALNSLSLRQRAASYLSGLRIRTGLTVHMAILDGTEAILIAKQEAQNGSRLASWVGKRMDMHATGIGKAMLAYLPKAEVEMIVEKRGLARHNENTIPNLRRLREELDYVTKVGYALDNEEDELGVRCLGVPILGPDGRPLAAISVAGTAEEIPFENIPHLAKDLRHTAKMLSQAVAESLIPAWPTLSVGSMAARRPSPFDGEEVPSLS